MGEEGVVGTRISLSPSYLLQLTPQLPDIRRSGSWQSDGGIIFVVIIKAVFSLRRNIRSNVDKETEANSPEEVQYSTTVFHQAGSDALGVEKTKCRSQTKCKSPDAYR